MADTRQELQERQAASLVKAAKPARLLIDYLIKQLPPERAAKMTLAKLVDETIEDYWRLCQAGLRGNSRFYR